MLACAQAIAQVSVLDPSFKIGPGADNTVLGLIVQADGRILVGGEFTSIGGSSNSFLARLSADGMVDQSYSVAGQTDGPIGCLRQQPDQKVLVGGSFTRLLGQTRQSLARLLEDGSIDPTFDAGAAINTNVSIFSLAVQADGRVLVAYTAWDDHQAHVVRFNTNGTPDSTFACTNQMSGYILALLPLADGSLLCGGNSLTISGTGGYGLFRLLSDGRLDDSFDPGLGPSSALCFARQTNGQILVGGLLYRTGAATGAPLLRLNADLHWDETFKVDEFVPPGGPHQPAVYSLLIQPDGKLVVGGGFWDVGGYWRRNIVRFKSDGHVDGCFDPGLGLPEGEQPGPVRTLALQPDGRILVGGWFHVVDTAYGQHNFGRLLSASDCDSVRVYLITDDLPRALATFPPGRTNYLEMSTNLTTWQTIQTTTSPYIWIYDQPTMPPCAFFRARQER